MPSPTPDARALGRRYRLALSYDPRLGPAGERLGSGTGASLEFQDRRDYAPGDDLRHLDWRALARTDTLLVRQYREEVLPRLELLVDGSASMGVDPAKATLAVDLAGVLVEAARAEGYRASVVLLEDTPERVDGELFCDRGLELGARAPLIESLRRASGLLAHGSLRILVSDLLSPFSPPELVRLLARGSGGLALLQVLAGDDLDPPRDRALRLVDAETGEELDLVVDDRLRARYLDRLERLGDALSDECRRHGASLVRLDARTPLEEHCRGLLSAREILLPA